jgi:pimeloyl-ACP methyl ester carboxylesterase
MKLCRNLTASLLIALGIANAAASAESPPAAEDQATQDTVVLLHGLWRSRTAMWLMSHRLENAGFQVQNIGYDSTHETPEQILNSVAAQIDACCKALPHTVHFVGHSLGGLIIRAYLADNAVRQQGRVVLIGTPNKGTPLVDAFQDSWWLALAGPTARALGTGPDSFPKSLPPPEYPVGVIAGLSENGLAQHLLADSSDGMVPVESTKLVGMVDFILVESGHSSMRYSEEVARQTISFLRRGRFVHPP